MSKPLALLLSSFVLPLTLIACGETLWPPPDVTMADGGTNPDSGVPSGGKDGGSSDHAHDAGTGQDAGRPPVSDTDAGSDGGLFLDDAGTGDAGEDAPTEFELSVIDEMNLARTAPKEYAETYIAPLSGQFSAAYFNECIAEMTAMAPVGALTHADGLWRMARAHATDQGAAGEVGHDRVDGSTFSDVVRQYGTFTAAGENISYGKNTARGIVIQLLVDDGVESRGHRKNLLSNTFTTCGVGFAAHTYYRYECVIDYAANWHDK